MRILALIRCQSVLLKAPMLPHLVENFLIVLDVLADPMLLVMFESPHKFIPITRVKSSHPIPHVILPLALVSLSFSVEVISEAGALSLLPASDVEIFIVVKALPVLLALSQIHLPVAMVFIVLFFVFIFMKVDAIAFSKVAINLPFVLVSIVVVDDSEALLLVLLISPTNRVQIAH